MIFDVTKLAGLATTIFGVTFASIDYKHTITLGSIILGIIVGLAGLVVFAYGARWKAAYEAEHAVVDSLMEGREAYKLRADRLEDELIERHRQLVSCTEAIGEQKQTIARLEALPNLSIVIDKMAESTKRADGAAAERLAGALDKVGELLDAQWRAHEEHADRRANELLAEIRLNRERIEEVKE
jgi:hypothetical protein